MDDFKKRTHGLVTNVEQSWFKALEGEFRKDYMVDLGKRVAEDRKSGKVYPSAEDVFAWTHSCPLKKVKVVILGQDPYPGENEAHGLAFSVSKGCEIPRSLRNIFKELKKEYPKKFETPSHGNLTGWAKQGVLLLNTVLTVKEGEANSHKDYGWEKLTDATLKVLNDQPSGLIFMLWGNQAKNKKEHIDEKKHEVLETSHPSPLSVNNGFNGCDHFKTANEYLKKKGKEIINWGDLP